MESNQKLFSFKKSAREYKYVLLSWLDKPHVREFFYGQGLQNTLDNIELYSQGINDNGCYSFEHWLVFDGNRPFAFFITSISDGPYAIEGSKTYTLDMLIGDEDYLGKGLAANLIKQFILSEFPQADYLIIDPEKANEKAIHVYEKAGFEKVEEFIPDYNPKPHVMMRMCVASIREPHM